MKYLKNKYLLFILSCSFTSFIFCQDKIYQPISFSKSFILGYDSNPLRLSYDEILELPDRPYLLADATNVFSRFIGLEHGIAVSSGTAALEVAVACIGLQPGDEVILPSFTIISCALAIIRQGGKPVLVDSEPGTWNMDVTQIEEKISSILFISLVFGFADFLRGFILTGFPWNLWAYSFSWSLESLQILSVIGLFSLNLFILLRYTRLNH